MILMAKHNGNNSRCWLDPSSTSQCLAERGPWPRHFRKLPLELIEVTVASHVVEDGIVRW